MFLFNKACTTELINKAGRESNVSSSPRPSQSQAPEDIFRLDILYQPSMTSGIIPDVDIVAVHGLSEGANSTWVFTPSTRITGGFGSARSKSDGLSIPDLETIMEGGAAVTSTLVNTVTTAAKQLTGLQADTVPSAQQHNRDSSRQQDNGAKPPHVQSSSISLTSDGSGSATPGTAGVNWLKDMNMLPRDFPRARIMEYRYPTASNSLKVVASELLQKLSEARKDFEPGLSRPIVLIGHSFGGIVISEALIMARKEGHPSLTGRESYSSLASAIAGLVFCTQIFLSRSNPD
jgi:hypothetical protein